MILFYGPGARPLAPHILLREAELAFTLKKVAYAGVAAMPLGHPRGALLAACHHLGGRLLRRGPGGGLGASRRPADLQHRPSWAQFTSEAFTDVLKDHKVDISMDGKGCWRDNVFVERLWRSVKYEEVYLKASLCAQGDESIPEARASLAKYFHFYNDERPHQALDRQTPWEAYTTVSWDLAA